MAFMTPEYFFGDFAEGEAHRDPVSVPWEYKDDIEWDEEPEKVTGWFARLSASGYLDATDWGGPFDTLDEARNHIEDTYEVDPDTGDDLEY